MVFPKILKGTSKFGFLKNPQMSLLQYARSSKEGRSYFNGVDSYAEFDSSIILDPSQSFNIQSYVTLDNLDTHCLYDSKATAFFRFDNYFRFGVRDDDGNTYSITGDDILANTEYKVNFIYDASTPLLTIALNDVIHGTKSPSSWSTFTIDILGRRSATTDLLAGFISNMTIEVEGVQILDLPMNELTNEDTGEVDYENRTGSSLYNATGYNITVV